MSTGALVAAIGTVALCDWISVSIVAYVTTCSSSSVLSTDSVSELEVEVK